MYSLLKDAIKFFQDNLSLIMTNKWSFLFFALIIVFFTILFCKTYYGHKSKNLVSKVEQIQAENKSLKSKEEKLFEEISKLNSQLNQYDAYRIIDKKQSKTSNDFSDQLSKEFSTDN